MLVGSFQSKDFMHKPVVDDSDRFPDGLLKGDVSHGIIWGVPLTEDYQNSVVNAWLCAPNNPAIFVVFDTEDYRRINKVEWYKALAKGSQDNFWEYIDDNADDAHSEIIIPHECSKDVKFGAFVIGLLSSYEDVDFMGVLQNSARTVNIDLFSAARRIIEKFGAMLATTDDGLEDFNKEQQEMFLRMRFLEQAFSLFYVPFLVCAAVNTLKLRDVPDSKKIGYWGGWSEYAEIYFQKFLDLENKFSDWSHKKVPDLNEYDILRQEFLNFFHQNSDVLLARVEHLGRNEPCPCGSGKKYKKCCGAGYM